MSQALQSAQQSIQNAGQQGDKGEKGGGKAEASESEMGEEFQAGGQPQPGDGEPKGNKSQNQAAGSGMGNAGRGAGGSAGPQQPLPGPKKNQLVKGMLDPRGKRLQRSYKGTPDPTQDRAAYYSVVPDKVKAAEASLNREEIPTGYKKQVRDYFDAIQPR